MQPSIRECVLRRIVITWYLAEIQTERITGDQKVSLSLLLIHSGVLST